MLVYSITLKMLRNDQGLWRGILFFIISGMSLSCHSYNTTTWNSCSIVQKKRPLLRPKSGNGDIPVQRKLVEVNRSHALPDNWLQYCGSCILGVSKTFYCKIEGLGSFRSSAFHSPLLEGSGLSSFQSHVKGRRHIFQNSRILRTPRKRYTSKNFSSLLPAQQSW